MSIGPKATEVLELRGLDVALLERLGVTASTMLGGEKAGALCIPFWDGDVRVGAKHRTMIGEKKFTQEKGSAQILYNQNCLRDETLKLEPIVITEGEVDCWSALQCGYQRTVSVPGGAPSERVKDDDGKKYRFVVEMLGLIGDSDKIILAVDGDDPGHNLRDDLAVRIGAHRCWFVKYPLETKDLNEVLMRYGQKGVDATLRRAQPMAIKGYYELADLPELVEPRAYTTGIVGMDAHYKLRLGDFTLITGVPGHGKSSFINEVTCRMAQMHGWKTVFASFEQVTQTDHRRALRSFYAEKREIDMTSDEKANADRWINNHFGFIIPGPDDDVSLEWLLTTAKSAVMRKEAQILAIDPWNEMDHTRPPDMTQTEYVGFAIKELKRFARAMNIHEIVAAHPAKLQRNKDGKYPKPTLYDVSDSAHWANKPDVGIVIYREDPKTNKTMIQIAKTRYHTIGATGEIFGAWNVDRTRYTIMEDETL